MNMGKKPVQKILITGGAGYIGLHLTAMLEKEGFECIVLDNLSAGMKHPILKNKLIEGNVGDKSLLSKIFQKHHFQLVIHLAALTDVNASIKMPLKYYENNVYQTLNLLECVVQYKVKYFMFASSAAVFSHTACKPIDEVYPTHPMTPYGRSKCFLECTLRDCYTAYGLNSIVFRYFNVAGADPELDLINKQKKWGQVIPALLQSIKANDKSFMIFGDQYETPDGTCLRDYIHVNDICQAHLNAIEKLNTIDGCLTYNLGTGTGFSVKQVVQAAREITREPFKTTITHARTADSPCVIANSSLAQSSLGWKPRLSDLNTLIETFWKWLI